MHPDDADAIGRDLDDDDLDGEGDEPINSWPPLIDYWDSEHREKRKRPMTEREIEAAEDEHLAVYGPCAGQD